MPSYIELDKQASFPASSNAGKLIFGFNTANQLAITDVSGNTTIIGAGCGNTPCNGDFGLFSSYKNWLFGSSGLDKFTTIQSEKDQTDYLTLELLGGSINGCNISSCSLSSITVNYTNLTYRDDGYGLYPSNYVDFLNGVFQQFGLLTTFSGTSSQTFVSNFYRLDDFTLIFKENGQIDSAPLSVTFFKITNQFGFLFDSFFPSINNIVSSGNEIIWPPY